MNIFFLLDYCCFETRLCGLCVWYWCGHLMRLSIPNQQMLDCSRRIIFVWPTHYNKRRQQQQQRPQQHQHIHTINMQMGTRDKSVNWIKQYEIFYRDLIGSLRFQHIINFRALREYPGRAAARYCCCVCVNVLRSLPLSFSFGHAYCRLCCSFITKSCNNKYTDTAIAQRTADQNNLCGINKSPGANVNMISARL